MEQTNSAPVNTKPKREYSIIKTIGRIFKDLKPIAWALAVAAIVCAGSVALSLIGPILIGELTDIVGDFALNGIAIDMQNFLMLALKLVVVYLGTAVLSILTVVLMTNITSRYYTYGVRVRISDKLQYMPVSFVDKTPIGEIISRMMNDVSNMSGSIHVIIELFISGILKIVAIVVLLYLIDPLMATIVVVLVPLSVVLAGVIASKSEKCWADYRKVNGNMYAFVEEDFTGFDTIKAFNMEERQKKICKDLLDDHGNKLGKGFWVSGLVQPIIALTNNIAYIGTCLLGGYFAIKGRISTGDLMVVILYAKMLAGPLESIAQGMGTINRTIVCAARVYKLLDTEEMSKAELDIEPQGEGDIEIKNVNFSYVEGKPIIKNLSVDVKAGQKVAIVGPTGGGKTTIVNLLMRFYEIDDGTITIDGVNISKMDRAKLRNQFSMVLQDTWLFSGSIYDNIAYGKENATREEVEMAAKRARIDHFIETLPEGYDTIINEESSNISGGQKQLLTIARAYLANRKMLILDEATSNVDTRTELLIQETMDELMVGKTSFVIAHRLSTIVNADTILVIRDGEVVEQGTHKELLAHNGFYTEIYNSQYDLLK